MDASEIMHKLYMKVSRVVRRQVPARWYSSTPNPVLAEALGPWATASSDIHDHLATIFGEAVAARPRLIVELGTRDGISTPRLAGRCRNFGWPPAIDRHRRLLAYRP